VQQLKFTLIGGHKAHLIAQLKNLGVLTSQKRVYYKLLTTSDKSKYKKLLSKKEPLPEEASSLSWELHKNSDLDYGIRLVYNNNAIDMCGLSNSDQNYICPLKTFRTVLGKLSN